MSKNEKLHLLVLALCPVLLVCTSLLNALLMAFVFFVLLVLSTFTISLFRNHLSQDYSVLAILLVNASWAASMELLLKAFFFDITIELGIYLPLLAMNSFLILSLQNTALLNDPLASLRTNLRQGTFVVMIICCVGLTRELLTHGALFTDAEFLSLIDIPTIEFYHRGLEILRSPFAVFFLLGLAYPLIVKLSGIMDVFRT